MDQRQSAFEAFVWDASQCGKTQIWIAVTTYLLLAIVHKELKLSGPLSRTLQILSVHPFERYPHLLLRAHQRREAASEAEEECALLEGEEVFGQAAIEVG